MPWKTKLFNKLKSRVLSREEKIVLSCFIIAVGFFSSVVFHYIQGMFLGKPYPLNTFLPSPNNFYDDFYAAFDQWRALHFTGSGFGLIYFPSTFLVIDTLGKLFSRTQVVFVYATFFAIFSYIQAYLYLRTTNFFESILYSFIVSCMTYPFLFAFQTGNVEIITFISLCLFLAFYLKKKKMLSMIFLAFAISMKAFPGVFIILFLVEKRYKDILLTGMLVAAFTLLPLLLYDGGFNKGLTYINHLRTSQTMYVNLMVMSDAGNHYGHSLLNGLRTAAPWLLPHMSSIMMPYTMFSFLFFSVLVGYIIFFEKILWRKVAVLTIAMDLLPYTSTDYKLLYFFLPLFLILNTPEGKWYDVFFVILLSVLLIPKDYFYLNDNPIDTINTVLNPVIMLIILLFIIFSGITTYKTRINIGKKKRNSF